MSPFLAATLADVGGDPRRGLDLIAGLGYRAVQINAVQPGLRPGDLDGSARRDLLANLRRRELVLAGVDLWVPPAHFDDPARVDRAVEVMLATVRMAGQLDRCPVSVRLPASGADAAIDLIAAEALRWGVPLADHCVGDQPPEPRGLGIDPAAWLADGRDPVAAVVAHGSRLAAARLVDLLESGARGPVGDEREGRLDVQAYCVALSVCGFERPVVADARQWPDPIAGLRQSLLTWDRAVVE